MSNINANELFIVAARKMYRFPTGKGGEVTVEDLFNISLTALDNIAVGLDEQITKLGRKSFVTQRTASSTDLENKLEIVKFVIETKQTEAEEIKVKAGKAEQRAFLIELKNKKLMAEIESLTVDEIDKKLAEVE